MCQSIPECNSKPLVWDLSVAKIRSSMTTVGVGAPKSTWESQKKMGSCIFLNMSHVFLNVDSVYFLWKLLWNLFSGNMSAQDLVLSVKFAFSCWEKLHQEKMTKPLSRGYVTKTLGLFHNKHYFAHKTFFFSNNSKSTIKFPIKNNRRAAQALCSIFPVDIVRPETRITNLRSTQTPHITDDKAVGSPARRRQPIFSWQYCCCCCCVYGRASVFISWNCCLIWPGMPTILTLCNDKVSPCNSTQFVDACQHPLWSFVRATTKRQLQRLLFTKATK